MGFYRRKQKINIFKLICFLGKSKSWASFTIYIVLGQVSLFIYYLGNFRYYANLGNFHWETFTWASFTWASFTWASFTWETFVAPVLRRPSIETHLKCPMCPFFSTDNLLEQLPFLKTQRLYNSNPFIQSRL